MLTPLEGNTSGIASQKSLQSHFQCLLGPVSKLRVREFNMKEMIHNLEEAMVNGGLKEANTYAIVRQELPETDRQDVRGAPESHLGSKEGFLEEVMLVPQ